MCVNWSVSSNLHPSSFIFGFIGISRGGLYGRKREDILTIVKRRKLQWYVWSCLQFIRSGQNHLARHSERGKETRQSEEDVGRQHLGMGRPGVRQVPEGSGEQGKMEDTGCKIICDAPTTLAVKGWMMMMITDAHPLVTLREKQATIHRGRLHSFERWNQTRLSSCIPPVNTVPHSEWSDQKLVDSMRRSDQLLREASGVLPPPFSVNYLI